MDRSGQTSLLLNKYVNFLLSKAWRFLNGGSESLESIRRWRLLDLSKPPLERREPPVIIALVILLHYLIGCLYGAKRALIGLLFCFSVSDSPCALRQNKSAGKVTGGGAAAEDLIVRDVHSFFFFLNKFALSCYQSMQMRFSNRISNKSGGVNAQTK